jgi:hypothetical protein
MKRCQPGRWLIAVALACLLPRGVAAQVTTEQSASILFFPKVIADGTWDTTIQIANVSSNQRSAHCFYVDAALANPDAPPGPDNLPVWSTIDFDIWLTPMQPTHWGVSHGRSDNPTDTTCDPTNFDCDGAGYDPGNILPVPPGFRGEAVCVEVDASGFPVPGNALIGKATLTNLDTGDIATYSAIGLHGEDSNNMDGVLCLGGGMSAQCPSGAEYAGCPDTWILDHPTDGSTDPVAGGTSTVSTIITVVPCRQDFHAKLGAAVTVQFLIMNAFEERFSASTTVTGWADVALSTIFQTSVVGSDYAQTDITTVDSSDTPASGIAVVAQTFRTAAGSTTSTATSLHSQGTRSDADLIVIPAQQ